MTGVLFFKKLSVEHFKRRPPEDFTAPPHMVDVLKLEAGDRREAVARALARGILRTGP